MLNSMAQVIYNSQVVDSGFMAAVSIIFVTSMAFLVFQLWLTYRLFQKAGQAGWKALIPIYNMVVLVRLGGFSGWWVAANLVPFLGQIVFSVILILVVYNITLNFNKPLWYIIIFFLFQIVWYMLIVFDKTAIWDPEVKEKIGVKAP